MRILAHPSRSELQLDAVLSALSDPVRRQIVGQLSDGPDDQTCSAFQLPVTKSTSTHHFRILREAGVIQQHYRGTAILNSLRSTDLEARFPGLLQAVLQAARHEAPIPPLLTGGGAASYAHLSGAAIRGRGAVTSRG